VRYVIYIYIYIYIYTYIHTYIYVVSRLRVNIIGDHADYVNILGRSIHTIKKNTEILVVASKEIGLEINADKTKYMVMSRDQNAVGSRDIKGVNSSFVGMEKFRYLGTHLRNQNSIQEENKCKLKSQNACCHSVQNLLYSNLLYKNINMKIYTTTDFLLSCKGVKLGQN
jgi:hypothetical protein